MVLHLLIPVVFFCAQVVLSIGLGDLLCQLFWTASAARAKLPEVSFCVGFCAMPVFGYIVMCVAGTPQVVLPAVLVLCDVLQGLLWRRGETQESDGTEYKVFANYLEFRRSPYVILAILIVVLFVAMGDLRKIPWMLETHRGANISLGTTVFDDARNIGFPLSLAAHGYPLKSPLQADIVLAYPVGAFVSSAGWISWWPAQAIAVVVSSLSLNCIFFALVVVLAISSVVRPNLVRLVVFGSAMFSVGFNLWNLHVDKAHWFNTFFGYYKITQLMTTITWTTFEAFTWIPNHVIAFAAAVFAAVLFGQDVVEFGGLRRGTFRICIGLAMFVAACSIDLTVMMTVAGAVLIGLMALRELRGPRVAWAVRALPSWVWDGVALCAVSLGMFLLIEAPGIFHRVDGPIEDVFQLIKNPAYNFGMIGSSVGLYFGLISVLLAMLGFRTRVPLWAIVPPAVMLAISLIVDWNTIWFWRATMCLHLMLALLSGYLASQVFDRGQPVRMAVALSTWLLVLLPGTYQTLSDMRGEWVTQVAVADENTAKAVNWIYQNTRLSDRVVQYREKTEQLVTSVDFLRSGNRAGHEITDRSLPLVGYKDYRARMVNLLQGILDNDYVLYHQDNPSFAAILESCHAPVRFEDAEWRIYEVDEGCRSSVDRPAVQEAFQHYLEVKKRSQAVVLEAADQQLQGSLMREKEYPQAVRERADRFWVKRQYSEAITFLNPIVKAHPDWGGAQYALAFSYQLEDRDLEAALDHFSAAMAHGFPEFWVRYNRGIVFLESGHPGSALTDLRRAHELDPNQKDVVHYLEMAEKSH